MSVKNGIRKRQTPIFLKMPMHNLFSIREAKIVKGERRDKRKSHFRLGYAEPHPIFAYCAKIMKGEHRTKFILVLLNSRLSYFIEHRQGWTQQKGIHQPQRKNAPIFDRTKYREKTRPPLPSFESLVESPPPLYSKNRTSRNNIQKLGTVLSYFF
ncbi:MAG TPA: hypothetical protein DCE67_07695 [Barnesiella intestinihominis]|uniref:Uncharacterized protein n=1 Tax=Barnesiella intestinihominis YIT 11860 TaxID=742726 RepID=K0WXJ1_9BACT|nr:hypothetical protein HMPREF9448_01781 [Barnesiella intestinihominis YIT 11860]CCX95057.1 putative uncharacterized protein [Bacteroides sp. CAG:20]HAC13550.1 hypothetical protein [Barnesiella intestinihominis]